MKIGQITTHYLPIKGGAEVYAEQLNQIFSKAGHQVTVYQPDNGERSPNVVPVTPRFKKLPSLLRFNLTLVPFFKKIAKEEVIVIHYPEHFWPFIWHPRTVVLTHGVNWEFNSKFRQLSRSLMAKFAYRFAWKFVANDTNFLREVGVKISPKEKMFEKVGSKQYFIPNCIDTNEFKQVSIPADLRNKKLIIVPRNFTYPRGVDIAVESMKIISKKDPSLLMLLVGDALKTKDSLEFKDRLTYLVKKLKLEEKVIFYGNRGRDEMPGIFSAGYITVIPTRGSEGTSLSALESMSVGTPVVTTAVAGLKDLPSYQCDPNPASVAEAILHVSQNRDRYSNDQSKVVREKYNTSSWTKAWLEVVGE